MAYVYILECYDKSFYTGATTNINRRIEQHKSGKGAKWTKIRLPIKLVYLLEDDDAFLIEKKIKLITRKKKKELINGSREVTKRKGKIYLTKSTHSR